MSPGYTVTPRRVRGQKAQARQKAGYDLKKLAIVGKDYHSEEHVGGYYSTGERMKYWGKLGAFWGSLWGLLFGAAFFAIPGVGAVIVAGSLVGWIVGTLEKAAAVGGLSALGAGFVSIGIPRDTAHGSGVGHFRVVVEHALAWFNNFRRLRLCYEEGDEHLQGFHDLAAGLIVFSRWQAAL